MSNQLLILAVLSKLIIAIWTTFDWLVHEREGDFLVDWHKALGAEDEALDTLRVEDVRWVAAKLNDILVATFSCCLSIFELIFELIRLHRQLREGLFASFAEVVLIAH